jgi:hypothetical protein
MFRMGTDAWAVIVRTLLVYVGVFVGLRVAGKRELGQMTVFDLAVVLLISNAVQNAMVGPISPFRVVCLRLSCCWWPIACWPWCAFGEARGVDSSREPRPCSWKTASSSSPISGARASSARSWRWWCGSTGWTR